MLSAFSRVARPLTKSKGKGMVVCIIDTPVNNRTMASKIPHYKHRKGVHSPKRAVVVQRNKGSSSKSDQSLDGGLFRPLLISPKIKLKDEPNVGEELAGNLDKVKITDVLKKFIIRPEARVLAAQHGLEGELFDRACLSFRRYCLEDGVLPVELHIVLCDILAEAGHVLDLFPFFLRHAKEVFPHLDCMEDLRKISDLTEPANWYPLARSIERKIIFHAGPTNSGKTYHALKRFTSSKTGVYCGPLRLLAMEVFDKSNSEGTPCDLVTGETRMFANGESACEHVSCTVEMMSTTQEYEVAVIDEIQMLAEPQRGWAWTRALLGVAAKEIHVCGEETAIDLVQKLTDITGDTLEVKRYDRLTSLTYQDSAVVGYDQMKAGDCVVCFNKADIFKISRKLQSMGHICAIIYGGLPPGTKIMQAKRFNDPDDPCNVLVATDAVGMGLNLAIKRLIFYTLVKPSLNMEGVLEIDLLTTSQAQQIGGRAGRYRTQYEDGLVTTFKAADLPILKSIVQTEKEPLQQAGLNPTAEQMEMFAYHLPKATLSNLLDIFAHVSQMDNNLYFMCNLEQFKELADLIEHLPLPLRTRYTFCSSPLKVRKGFASTMFIKLARQFSSGQPMTFSWLCRILGAPFSIPKTVAELERLEGAFDVIDIYLWLSYRFPDMFLDTDEIRALRVRIDAVIQKFLTTTRNFIPRIIKIDDVLENAFSKNDTETVGKSTQKDEKIKNVLEPKSEIELTTFVENNPLLAYMPKPKKTKDTSLDVNSLFPDSLKVGYKATHISSGVDGRQMGESCLELNQMEDSGLDARQTSESGLELNQIEDSGLDARETGKSGHTLNQTTDLELDTTDNSGLDARQKAESGLDFNSPHSLEIGDKAKHLYDDTIQMDNAKELSETRNKNIEFRRRIKRNQKVYLKKGSILEELANTAHNQNCSKPELEQACKIDDEKLKNKLVPEIIEQKHVAESHLDARQTAESEHEHENTSDNVTEYGSQDTNTDKPEGFFSFTGMKIKGPKQIIRFGKKKWKTKELNSASDNLKSKSEEKIFNRNNVTSDYAEAFKKHFIQGSFVEDQSRLDKASAETEQPSLNMDADKDVIKEDVSIANGNLTKRLLDEGLLTKTMLEKLQKEWENKRQKSKSEDKEEMKTDNGR